jgi:outer membrane protein
MMRPFIGLLALIVALVVSSTPSFAEVFSLAEALANAYETNPRLDAARAGLRSVDEGVAQANAGWRPSINASTTYGVQHGTVQGVAKAFNTRPFTNEVSVTESIFRGGRTYAEVSRAIAQVHAGRAELLKTEQAVLLDTVTAYMDVVRDTNNLKLNEDNLRSLQTELDAVRTQHSAGAVTRTDVDQSEARLARAQSNVANAEQQLAASRAAFEAVIGRPAETLEELPALPALPGTKDMAVSLAMKQNPDVLQAQANVSAADYAVDDAIGALLPQISVSGQYQYVRDAAGTNIYGTKLPQQILSVVGQITVPIYQGGAEEASVRRAKELRDQSQYSASVAERGVRQDVNSAWQAVQSAQAAVVANQAQAKADESAVEGVTQEQQGGERSVLDILNAQQELLSAQIAVESSRRDTVVAAYQLLSTTGQLTAKSLGLTVKFYNPLEHYEDDAARWVGFGD